VVESAIIPAAGLGTRLLPATRAVPKVMLPLVDTPVIQIVVEEAVAAGITDIVIVTGPGQEAIKEHFRPDPDLERRLEARGDIEIRDRLRRLTELADLADIRFVTQPELRGLGEAVLRARSAVGSGPFAVLLGDTVVTGPGPAIGQLAAVQERIGHSVVAVEEAAEEVLERYGVVGGTPAEDGLIAVSEIVEKPPPGRAPSRWAIAGRYVLTPTVFDTLADLEPGRDGEIGLTDALAALIGVEGITACPLTGRRYDTGSKIDYVRATLDLALARAGYRDRLHRHLRGILERWTGPDVPPCS